MNEGCGRDWGGQMQVGGLACLALDPYKKTIVRTIAIAHSYRYGAAHPHKINDLSTNYAAMHKSLHNGVYAKCHLFLQWNQKLTVCEGTAPTVCPAFAALHTAFPETGPGPAFAPRHLPPTRRVLQPQRPLNMTVITTERPPRDFAPIDIDLCRARVLVWESASSDRWNAAIEHARRIERLSREMTACLEARASAARTPVDPYPRRRCRAHRQRVHPSPLQGNEMAKSLATLQSERATAGAAYVSAATAYIAAYAELAAHDAVCGSTSMGRPAVDQFRELPTVLQHATYLPRSAARALDAGGGGLNDTIEARKQTLMLASL